MKKEIEDLKEAIKELHSNILSLLNDLLSVNAEQDLEGFDSTGDPDSVEDSNLSSNETQNTTDNFFDYTMKQFEGHEEINRYLELIEKNDSDALEAGMTKLELEKPSVKGGDNLEEKNLLNTFQVIADILNNRFDKIAKVANDFAKSQSEKNTMYDNLLHLNDALPKTETSDQLDPSSAKKGSIRDGSSSIASSQKSVLDISNILKQLTSLENVQLSNSEAFDALEAFEESFESHHSNEVATTEEGQDSEGSSSYNNTSRSGDLSFRESKEYQASFAEAKAKIEAKKAAGAKTNSSRGESEGCQDSEGSSSCNNTSRSGDLSFMDTGEFKEGFAKKKAEMAAKKAAGAKTNSSRDEPEAAQAPSDEVLGIEMIGESFDRPLGHGPIRTMLNNSYSSLKQSKADSEEDDNHANNCSLFPDLESSVGPDQGGNVVQEGEDNFYDSESGLTLDQGLVNQGYNTHSHHPFGSAAITQETKEERDLVEILGISSDNPNNTSIDLNVSYSKVPLNGEDSQACVPGKWCVIL
jgi:hypothetical protein